MRVIVGLGNPGDRFKGSRHNVGFQCLDAIAKKWGIPARERRAKAVLGRGHFAGQEVVLAKPRTFMNNSGEGISYLLTRFGAKPEDLVVIYDERALPLGRLRIRSQGSDAGHNGVRSIISALHTEAFPRIRVGIGNPPEGQDSVPFVLGRFTAQELIVISQTIEDVVAAVESILEENIDIAMNHFNTQPSC